MPLLRIDSARDSSSAPSKFRRGCSGLGSSWPVGKWRWARAGAAVGALAPGRPALCEAYDACLQWLEHFRATHLEYAARYIHRQSQASAANPTAQIGRAHV